MEPEKPTIARDLPDAPDGATGWPWVAEPADFGGGFRAAWPRITIVTPSFQQAPYLEACLRSVLLQGYPNLEYIVIDGGSRDGSVDIIARYAPFLAFWKSETDSGQANAINQGFTRATGEIVGWINSDDLLLPGALFAVADAFLSGSAEIVYGDALNLFEEDDTLQYWQGFWITRPVLRFGGVISSHAVFWRRSVHVPLWEDLNCSMDQELWQRLVPGRRMKYLPRPLGVCRQHGESKSSHERWRERWRQDDEKIWARHGRPSTNPLFRQWYAKTQRLFKWVSWIRGRAARRRVLAACGWERKGWRGPRP